MKQRKSEEIHQLKSYHTNIYIIPSEQKYLNYLQFQQKLIGINNFQPKDGVVNRIVTV